MRANCFIVVAAITALTLTAGFAFAGPGGCCGGWGPGAGKGYGVGPRTDLPDLSPDQRKQARDLETAFLKKTDAVRNELRKKRYEMRDLASAEKYDSAAVQKKREEIWALTDKLRNERRAYASKMDNILTPEQRQKFGPGAAGGFGGCNGPGRGYGKWRGGPGACPGGGRGFGPGNGCGFGRACQAW